MQKVVRIGTIDPHGNNGHRVSVYFQIATRDYGLSFTGVIGPRISGNAAGGCGQIDMEFAHRNPAHNDARYTHLIKPEDIHFARGWDKEKLFDVLDAWQTYHLKHNVPASVIEFLESLPDTDRTPAWV